MTTATATALTWFLEIISFCSAAAAKGFVRCYCAAQGRFHCCCKARPGWDGRLDSVLGMASCRCPERNCRALEGRRIVLSRINLFCTSLPLRMQGIKHAFLQTHLSQRLPRCLSYLLVSPSSLAMRGRSSRQGSYSTYLPMRATVRRNPTLLLACLFVEYELRSPPTLLQYIVLYPPIHSLLRLQMAFTRFPRSGANERTEQASCS